jgi:hypothetical protein
MRLIFTEFGKAIQAFYRERLAIDRQSMADLTRYAMALPNVQNEIADGIAFMRHIQAPRHRPMVLVSEGDEFTPTIWLLGWRERECDMTPIHNHDDSEVALLALQGSVYEDIYPNMSLSAKTRREFQEGSLITMPAPYTHRVGVNCGVDGMAVTLHSYYPKLDKMDFFEEQNGALVQNGSWVE